MSTNIFSKWKKEDVVTGHDDDLQQPQGRIILERMASIMTSDEANKKETPTIDLPTVIDKSETRVQETALKLETGEEKLATVQNSGTEVLFTKIEVAIDSDHNEIIISKPQEKSESHNREPMPKESPVILVVEDEPVTQKMIKQILEERGYGVVIAGDGIDALMELGKRAFDLILSDLSMPNMDGFKLLDFINMKSIKAPIIFLTVSDDVEDEIKVLALGAKDYIRKPINRDLLILRISKVLLQSN